MCIDHFRVVKRNPAVKTSDDDNLFNGLNFSESGVDKKMISDDTNNKLGKILDMLPDVQREVIILRHYADLSFKEIASMTNCSINTSLGRMRYALTNMRKLMNESEMA
jgi:RNA polymerase sigma-70 factor (ECF subfamily)